MPDGDGNSTFSLNPMGYLFDNFVSKTTNLTSNLLLSYQIVDGLDLKSSFGYTTLFSNVTQKNFLESIMPEELQWASRGASYGNSSSGSWTIEPQLSYARNISRGRLELLLGTTIQQNEGKYSQLFAYGFSNDLVMDDILSATGILATSSASSQYKYNALFARMNYNWKNKYILNLSGRRDGSSRFGPKSQFHDFAAIGSAWVFSEEEIIKQQLPFLSYGKLRGSYGTTGSDQIGEYKFLSLYNPIAQDVPYNGITAYQPTVLNNPYLEWESTKKMQFGLDLGFFKDRILLNANYYRNRSSNQLQEYGLPSTSGFRGITRNQPFTIENSGWEMMILSTNIKAADFSWSTNFNITIPKTLLVKYPNQSQSSDYYSAAVGKPLGAGRLFHYLGVDQASGIYQFADKNGNPTTNPDIESATIWINPFPKFYGGFQNTISYKGFQLDLLFSFVKQAAKNFSFGYNTPGSFNGGSRNQLASLKDRWQKPGDIARIQKYTTGSQLIQSLTNVYNSDAAYVGASYARLKNFSLSWRFPKKWVVFSHLQNCSIFTQGQNLFTITNYTGLDPETKNLNTLPPLRAITFGIKVEL